MTSSNVHKPFDAEDFEGFSSQKKAAIIGLVCRAISEEQTTLEKRMTQRADDKAGQFTRIELTDIENATGLAHDLYMLSNTCGDVVASKNNVNEDGWFELLGRSSGSVILSQISENLEVRGNKSLVSTFFGEKEHSISVEEAKIAIEWLTKAHSKGQANAENNQREIAKQIAARGLMDKELGELGI